MEHSDLDDIVRIENQCFPDAWSRDSFVRDLGNAFVITLVARLDDRCVGYGNCLRIDEYGYLANIAVDPALHSRGIGRMLVSEFCRRLRRDHKRQMLLDVRPSNRRAVEFYKRLGFQIIVQRQNFYTNPVEDSYTMSLDLGS
jgi:ribosomal-protein-alanine N-acetyltransferase